MQLYFHGNRDMYIPEYRDEKRKLNDFIATFEDPAATRDPIHGKLKYMALL